MTKTAPLKRRSEPKIVRGPETPRTHIGEHIAKARRERGWTLMQLSEVSGVASGTLSKVENGKSGASYDTVARVARALGLRLDDLLTPAAPSFASGRRSISRAGDKVTFGFANYDYDILCNDLIHKSMVPVTMTIKAREVITPVEWSRHPGEEYMFVLAGVVELHTEFYAPVRLEAGDSAYIDSAMGHAFASVGEGDAVMLCVCSGGSAAEVVG